MSVYPTPFTVGVSAYTEGADDAHGNPVVTYATAVDVAVYAVAPGTPGEDPFSTSFVSGSTSGNPWLAAADKITLKPYRVMGGAVSVALRSDRAVLPYTGSITI